MKKVFIYCKDGLDKKMIQKIRKQLSKLFDRPIEDFVIVSGIDKIEEVDL